MIPTRGQDSWPERQATGWRRWQDPLVCVEAFVVGNLAFLALDIYLAHGINDFAHPAEWVPFVFSLVSPVVLLAAMAAGGITASSPPQPGEAALTGKARWVGIVVGGLAIVVGVAGMILHLESQFFVRQTIRHLVYTAPFVAPLAYTGLGCLLVMDRMTASRSREWAGWVVLLAGGGFVGNFVLSLADHAQNGFFYPTEWIPVFATALAVGFLAVPLVMPVRRGFLKLTALVMVLQIIVGVLGFVLHVQANLLRPGATLLEQFLYGAPLFAPLLLPDLALLALIGLWGMARCEASAAVS